MLEQQPSYQERRTTLVRYQIPTHLNVPDKILSAWGFGITVRQMLVLLIAWSAVANTWVRTAAVLAMLGTPGAVLHFVATAIPGFILLVVAFKQVAGRYLEVWLLVLLRYWLQPKVYLWRPVRVAAEAVPRDEEAEPLADEAWGEQDAALDLWWP